MNRITLFMLISFAFPVLVLAQPQHFTFTANTGDSYSIVVNSVTLDEVPLDVGDEIGVFTPAGLCVGASVWTGTTPLALTAWIDDSQTPEVDGYTPGDTMSFKIWQQSSDTEFPATATYAQGNGTFGDGAFASVSLTAVSGGQPSGILVTNTNDSGVGSLREAIQQANTHAGPDTITFAIPESDPGYHDVAGTWTIALTNALPAISDDSLSVDGESQASFIGRDANPDGPEIVVNGSQLTTSSFGFFITSAGNRVHHLVLNGFDAGVYMTGENAQFNSVTGCFIGTDATGSQDAANNSGIQIYSANNTIGGTETGAKNLLSGNRVFGVLLSGEQANNNRIIGNFIGTDASGSNALANQAAGIMIQLMPSGNEIGGREPGEGNLISGNGQDGIRLSGVSHAILGNLIGTDATGSAIIGNGWAGISIGGGGNHTIGGTETGAGNTISGNNQGGIQITSASVNNHVFGNFIGTNASGTEPLGNVGSGVWITGKAKSNMVGPNNLIAFNQFTGVSVSSDSTLFNTITQNSIWSNSERGIEISDGGNAGVQPPVVSRVSDGVATGTAPANATVEIFSDEEDEGAIYEGSTTADANGNFQWSGTLSGPNVTATATDAEGNTSPFSNSFDVTSVESGENVLPEKFSLKQNFPNPFNPATTISFALPNQARVFVQVFDLSGREVARLLDEVKPAGQHEVVFDASGIPSGVYFYRLQAMASGRRIFTQTKKFTLIK